MRNLPNRRPFEAANEAVKVGGTLEITQAMAAHEIPWTTRFYDRIGDEITLDEAQRLVI